MSETRYSDLTDWQMMGLIGTREKLSEDEQEQLDLEIKRRGYSLEEVAHMRDKCRQINSRMAIVLRVAPFFILAIIALFVLNKMGIIYLP